EIGFRYADAVQRLAHAGPGALAHADRRDVRGLEQRHAQVRSGCAGMGGGDDGGRQPAGRTAADDDDMLDLEAAHDLYILHDLARAGAKKNGPPVVTVGTCFAVDAGANRLPGPMPL